MLSSDILGAAGKFLISIGNFCFYMLVVAYAKKKKKKSRAYAYG